jgi:hypothetical protein
MVVTKTFSNETLSTLESDLNTFLATLDPKNVLDVIFTFSATSKYGMNTTYTALVVYKS